MSPTVSGVRYDASTVELYVNGRLVTADSGGRVDGPPAFAVSARIPASGPTADLPNRAARRAAARRLRRKR